RVDRSQRFRAMQGRMAKILVTAGPTREHIDAVRFLSNGSTGRMGYALAAAAVAAGHDAVLVSGPTALPCPPGVERIDVVSAREMHDRALAAFVDCDAAIGAAAVADHRPAHPVDGKPAKEASPVTLELVPNPDVIAALAAAARASETRGRRRVVVGFALEAFGEDSRSRGAAEERARAKLARKQLDWIVLNRLDALGSATNRMVLLGGEGAMVELHEQLKDDAARALIAHCLAQIGPSVQVQAASEEES
ncbi:MAG: phosphopantothenoylcysteine decarboxylase, partial [Planctomycetota bacterium]